MTQPVPVTHLSPETQPHLCACPKASGLIFYLRAARARPAPALARAGRLQQGARGSRGRAEGSRGWRLLYFLFFFNVVVVCMVWDLQFQIAEG